MTISSELILLASTKQAIKTAIENKGVYVGQSSFADYPSFIDQIPTGAIDDDIYVRPADWLPLPVLTATDQKFVGLHAIYEDSNFVALRVDCPYTVDWGDGMVENYGASVNAQHIYDFNNPVFNGTLCTRGYKQAVVIVTPQGTANLNVVDVVVKHPQAGLNSYSSSFLDVSIAGQYLTSFVVANFASMPSKLIEQVSSIKNAITNFSSMFASCLNLRSVPVMDTSSGTNFYNMFNNCPQLKYVPMMDTSKGTSFASMFSACVSLKSIPLLNTALSLNCDNMFQGCTRLKTIPLLDTHLLGSFVGMFQGCSGLMYIPLLNTSNATMFDNMMQDCTSLETIPALVTTKGTRFLSMFQGCTDLRTIPLIDTSKATTVGNMFNGCSTLQTLPALNFALVASNQGNFLSNFGQSPMLSKSDVVGMRQTHNYSGGKLSATALNNIYTNLGTAVAGAVITVSNNWGTATDNPAIATAKGWTVTG